MSSVRLTWLGDKIMERVREAEVAGLNTTGRKMVDRARQSHPGWKSRTGAAEASIAAEPAERTASVARLRFGSSLARFIFLEIGARGRAGDHTLRRAGDVEGGHLPDHIRRAFGK